MACAESADLWTSVLRSGPQKAPIRSSRVSDRGSVALGGGLAGRLGVVLRDEHAAALAPGAVDVGRRPAEVRDQRAGAAAHGARHGLGGLGGLFVSAHEAASVAA